MGFFKEINDAFMEGLWRPRKVPFFGVTVKKSPSPVDPRRLSKSYRAVRGNLARLHTKQFEQWSEVTPEDPHYAACFAHAMAYDIANLTFHACDISRPEKRLLFNPMVAMVEGILATDPRFLELVAPDISAIPVDEHFALSEKLAALERFLKKGETVIDACSNHLFAYCVGTFRELPEAITKAKLDADLSLSTQLVEAFPDPHEMLATTLRHFAGFDAGRLRDHELLAEFRERLIMKVLDASGLTVEDLDTKDPDTPMNHLDTPAAELATRFLGNTSLTTYLLTPVPYAL